MVILIIMSDDKEAVLQRGFVFVQKALHTPFLQCCSSHCKEPGKGRTGQTGTSEGFSGQLSSAGANPYAQLLVLIWISHWVQTASSSLLADLFGSEHSILISPIRAQSPWEVKEPGTQVSSSAVTAARCCRQPESRGKSNGK